MTLLDILDANMCWCNMASGEYLISAKLCTAISADQILRSMKLNRDQLSPSQTYEFTLSR